MQDEAEAGLLYESQSKLMRSRRLLRWFRCTVQHSDACRGPCSEETWMLQVPSHSAVCRLGPCGGGGGGGVGGEGGEGGREGRMCARPSPPTVVPIPSLG